MILFKRMLPTMIGIFVGMMLGMFAQSAVSAFISSNVFLGTFVYVVTAIPTMFLVSELITMRMNKNKK